jgi:hypothetical protein
MKHERRDTENDGRIYAVEMDSGDGINTSIPGFMNIFSGNQKLVGGEKNVGTQRGLRSHKSTLGKQAKKLLDY